MRENFEFKVNKKSKHISNNLIDLKVEIKKYKYKQRSHCGLSDSEDSNENTCALKYQEDQGFIFNDSNFGIQFQPFSNIKGNIYIKAIGNSFNHASCDCERYLKHTDSKIVYRSVSIKLKYQINLDTQIIRLKYVPTITL